MTAEQVQLDVVEELAFDPAVDSSRIAVTVAADGIVTLDGSAPDFAQVRAAEAAAKRVRGVRAVVNELQVDPPALDALVDTPVAGSALRALDASVSVPEGAVTLSVQRGWVTLDGTVEWDFQRRAAFDAVRDLRGVRGVTNLIRIRERPTPAEVRQKIEAALRRDAQLDAMSIHVATDGGRVTLEGTVSSWTESEAAERAAYAAAGVTAVVNRIEVRPSIYAY